MPLPALSISIMRKITVLVEEPGNADIRINIVHVGEILDG
jgi:hypothetical protein